jgi:DNA polymerase III subunit delta'
MTQMIGHDSNLAQFNAALSAGKLHHGWILAGSRGLGKAHFARNVARLLVDPINQYATLIDRGTHPDIITISRLPKEPPKEGEEVDANAEKKRNIGVDQIRSLQSRLTTRPGLSDKRAIIIDAADDMERSTANALLKSLEEPPVGTYFFLVCHASDKLLPTIRSRCQLMRFEPLHDADMARALRTHLPDISDHNLNALVRVGAGAPGHALVFADLDLARLEDCMKAIIESGDPQNTDRSALAQELSLKAAQPRYEAFLRRAPHVIAEHARNTEASEVAPVIDAWHAASNLAGRAIGLTLDKQSVVLQMGSLLASLQAHKHPRNLT